MNFYRVRAWCYSSGTRAQVMYIRAPNARKARELFVDMNPDKQDMKVWNVNYKLDMDQLPEQWKGAERGYSAWMELDYFGSANIDLERADFQPFQTRKEKIRALFKS